MSRVALSLIVFLQLFIFQKTLAGDPNLDKGWEYFAQNNYSEAKASFTKALSGSEKAKAYLALSLIESAVGTHASIFDYHYKFVNSSANVDNYIEALWSLESGKKSDQELELLEKLAETKKGFISVKSNQALGYHYYAIKKNDKGDEYFNKIGAVKKWSVVGEFENISESGFDADYKVLEHPEKDYTFQNKKGVPVQWFDINGFDPNNWIDFSHHFYIQNSIVYAQTFCLSPVEQEVHFRVGVSGSVKSWVNDKLIFQEAKERDNQVDSYVYTVRLNKGYNRILFQLGSSEIYASNLILRITNDQGVNISGLKYSTKSQEYDKNYNYESKIITNKAIEFFEQRIKENPRDLESGLILTQYYNANDYSYKGRKLLTALRKEYPDCTLLTIYMIQALSADDDRTGASTLLEEIKQRDKDNPAVMSLLISEAFDKDDLDEAETLLSKYERTYGKDVYSYKKRIAIASSKKELETFTKLVDAGYAKYPTNSYFVLIKYYFEKNVKKNNYNAIKILKKYLKKNYDNELQNILVSEYFSQGNVTAGLKEYNVILDHNPLSTHYHSSMASIQYSLRNYTLAKVYVQKCIEIAPYKGSYHETLAQAYKESGYNSMAIDEAKKAIKFSPFNYDARELLRELEGGEKVFEQFDEPDPEELFKESPSAEEYPEDNSIILLHEVQKVVYDGGGSEEKHHLMVKMFSNSGVDVWKEYYLPIYGNQNGIVEQLDILKKDGSRLEAERSGTHIVFPNLEPGDAIYIVYKVQNYHSGKLSTHFWDQHYMSYFYPVLTNKFTLLVPKNKEFKYELKNSDIEPTISEGSDNDQYVWELNNQPSHKYETYMPNLSDIGVVLNISSFENWDFVADWYHDLSKAKSKSDFLIEETVAELFKGKENLSEMEKARLIYDYIVTNIRYVSVPFIQSGLIPQKASEVISSKQGDCKDVSTLFVALCQSQGIDANLVLINTRSEGSSMPLPSIGFNHCIAKATIDFKPYYVELTTENLPFASGFTSLTGVVAIEIPQDNSQVTEAMILDAPNRTIGQNVRTAKVSFDNGEMHVEKTSRKYGYMAQYMRDTYKDEGKVTQEKYMKEAINNSYPNVKLTKLEFVSGLDDKSDVVEYQYSYKVASVFSNVSNLSIFKLPWADKFSKPDFMSYDERTYPIELWKWLSAEEYDETLTISMPTGMKLSEIPDNVAYSNAYLSYELTYKMVGANLIVQRKMTVKDKNIPKEDYQVVKEAIEKIIKDDETNLAFKAI